MTQQQQDHHGAEDDFSGGRRHFRRKTTFPAKTTFLLQILDRLLSPTNFHHKHHGAISSRYAQIRAGEFGGRRRRTDGRTEDNWFSKGLMPMSSIYAIGFELILTSFKGAMFKVGFETVMWVVSRTSIYSLGP